MTRDMYREFFAWSMVECEGCSWQEVYALVDLVLEPCIQDLQAQEDARMFRILEDLAAES